MIAGNSHRHEPVAKEKAVPAGSGSPARKVDVVFAYYSTGSASLPPNLDGSS